MIIILSKKNNSLKSNVKGWNLIKWFTFEKGPGLAIGLDLILYGGINWGRRTRNLSIDLIWLVLHWSNLDNN